jgi:predicted hydrocarbon binding protein
MKISNKIDRDPVTEVPQIEAYMRYALIAAEEMVGKQALALMLQQNGMARFIGNYPPDRIKLSHDFTHKDYTNLCTALIEFYGQAGKSESIRFGRISTKPALENQGVLFNFASRTAIKFLPLSLQIKTVLESIKNDLDKIYKEIDHDVSVKIEDRGDKWAYIDRSCALCAGKESDAPICWGWVGTLAESLNWLTGKEFEIDQVECRAMGESACVWEISKVATIRSK